MNIFILDNDLQRSAQMLCDQHLGKQILEIAQILCTVTGKGDYKPTHKHHPVTMWARDNLDALYWYARVLDAEFQHRFGKQHKSSQVIERLRILTHNHYNCMDVADLDSFPIRNDLQYYKEKLYSWLHKEKPIVARWTNRDVPDFYKEVIA